METVETPQCLTDQLVVRRARRLTVTFAAFELVLLAYVGMAVWQGLYSMIALGVVGSISVAVAAFGWVRGRTELRPDGIRNRTMRAEQLIPWADVTKVMPVGVGSAIIVICRDGRRVSLAGAQGRRPRNGPDLVEIIDFIQARIDEHAPAGPRPDKPVPPTIERRLSWQAVRHVVTVCAVIGLVTMGFAFFTLWLLSVAILLLGLAGFLALVTARSRTEIGPDGIRNRAVRKQVFIPWSEITAITGMDSPPRVVQVVRADGTKMTLAAVRDGDAAPDGLGFDDIVEVIQERAGLDTAPGPEDAQPLAGQAIEPVTLRPSRRPLLWLLPLATAFLPAAYWTFDGVVLVFVSSYLLLVPVILLTVVFKLLRGRTDAGPDGLRNRMVIKTTPVGWKDVDGFVVNPTLFGRVLQVRRRSGKRITLAAPREGLLGRNPEFDEQARALQALAAAHRPSVPPISDPVSQRAMRIIYCILLAGVLAFGLTFWRPWLEPWWPGRHEATSLPRACAVSNEAGPRLVPGGRIENDEHNDDRYFVVSRCSWAAYGSDADLDLDLEMDRKNVGSTGTSQAREEFGQKRDIAFATGARQIPGLGAEAWEKDTTTNGVTRVRLAIRRANVVIELDYDARRPAAQVVADATALARTVVSGIRVG